MEIKKDTSGPIAILEVFGDLGLYNLGSLREVFEELRAGGRMEVLLNMQKAAGIDSMGIGLLLQETERFKKNGGALKLSQISVPVLKSLQIAAVLPHLETYDDNRGALASFNSSRAP